MKFRASLLCFAIMISATAQAQPPLAQARATVNTTVNEASRRTINQTIKVAMRDGTELALEVFRADDMRPRSTLYASGPLPLGEYQDAPDLPHIGPVTWWLDQGFNVVIAATRGTGESGGEFDFMGREEQQDHYEIIEWIAAQAWSDQQVAGLGADYYGSSQWFMAIQNPPHLSCIAPVTALLDPYDDWAWHQGLGNSGLLHWYERDLRQAWAYPANGDSRYVDFDLQRQLLEHRVRDSWWQLRSAITYLDNVETAVFQIGSWRHADALWTNNLARLESMPATTFTWVGSSRAPLQNQDFLEQELLPWYQWCFSGKPRSGPALQPALRYQVVNSVRNRASSGWPPANIKYTPLFAKFNNDAANEGLLVAEPDNGERNHSVLQSNASITESRIIENPVGASGALILRSEVLETAVDLAGPLLLQFHVSSSSMDTAVEVELYEEVLQVSMPTGEPMLPDLFNPQLSASAAPQLSTRLELISSGRVKAARRSTIEKPGATAVHSEPGVASLLTPGRINRFDLALAPRAWQLRAGSRLVLAIRQANDPSLRHMERRDTLYHSEQYPSQLWLPLSADSQLLFRLPQPSTPAMDPLTEELFNGDNPLILLPSATSERLEDRPEELDEAGEGEQSASD